ncbi:hypothetical protein [Bacillus atrophaeus]|uniref:hypothetical protein n=1 Tax=Bacillus atrophaeus TaxID=1452 RepID=UPI00077963F2|nr:hypothetical protein [Bacillus atrophaeus]KYD05351.1 hypothetical protein B4144_1959 [Bacillus atrophaeus]
MTHYRKKPVVVEAMLYKGECNYKDVCAFVDEELFMEYHETDQILIVPNVAGELRADKGDFIIKGLDGEFYP